MNTKITDSRAGRSSCGEKNRYPVNPVMNAMAVSLTLLGAASAGAVVLPGGPNGLDPLLVPKFNSALVIPPEMPKTVAGSTYNSNQPAADYNIAERQFAQQILPIAGCSTRARAAAGFKPPVCAGTAFKPTTVWSYGRADDAAPAVAPVPAADSSFNYPAFTMETVNGTAVNVRWINELVTLTNGRPTIDSRFLPSLTPVDQSLHWANPGKLPCLHPTASGTDCEPDPAQNPNLAMPYAGPVPMAVHVHGAEVNPQSDGYAEAWWLPAAANIPAAYVRRGSLFTQADTANSYPGSALFHYENDQAPATIWYHDHTLGMTRNNVYSGPAGYWMVRGNSPTTPGLTDLTRELPGGTAVPGAAAGSYVLGRPTYPGTSYPAFGAAGNAVTASGCDPNFDGVCRQAIREIPIALQDRSFNADGSLFFPATRDFFQPGPAAAGVVPYKPAANTDVAPVWNPEFFGNANVVNGVAWPNLTVYPQRYRFRFLNGSGARTYNLYAMTLPASLKPAEQNVMSNATVLSHVRRRDQGYQEVPFYQIGAEQGFLPKVVKITKGVAVQLPGNDTNVNGRCRINTAVAPAYNGSNANDPLCERGLLMMPAERADVIMDFTGLPAGTQVRFINWAPDLPFGGFLPTGLGAALAADPTTTGKVMTFTVANLPAGAPADASLSPLSLKLPSEKPLDPGIRTRRMALLEGPSDDLCMELDAAMKIAATWNPATFPYRDPNVCIDAAHPAGLPYAPRQTQLGNVDGNWVPSFQAWMDPITAAPQVGTTEDWEIYNTTVDAHPMHMHQVRFQVLNREPLASWLDNNTGLLTNVTPCMDAAANAAALANSPNSAVQPLAGPCAVKAAELSELGYKDTVMTQPGEVTRVRAMFVKPGLYVWHCHVVDHEDNEMMHPMYVVDPALGVGASMPAFPSMAGEQNVSITNHGVGL